MAMDMRAVWRWLPQSLIARVYALYSVTLLMGVSVSLFLFYQYQFKESTETAQESAAMLIEVAAQTVADSAVIGDYDTIKRTLDKAVLRSQFESAVFIDLAGAHLVSDNRTLDAVVAPGWLQARVAEELSDVNRAIVVGGKDYGVLRLSFDTDAIAGRLWSWVRSALALAAGSLLVGLALIWFPLKCWLGTLDRVRTFEDGRIQK